MDRLLLLMLAEARKATEPLIRVIMLQIARILVSMTDMLRTKSDPGSMTRSKGIDHPHKGVTGQTLIGRPASGLASRLARALGVALGVSAASLISEII